MKTFVGNKEYIKEPALITTRQANEYQMIDRLFLKTKYNNSVFSLGPREWNLLPICIKQVQSKASFKFKMNKYLANKFAQDGYI